MSPDLPCFRVSGRIRVSSEVDEVIPGTYCTSLWGHCLISVVDSVSQVLGQQHYVPKKMRSDDYLNILNDQVFPSKDFCFLAQAYSKMK